jgi:hypothetical protein
MALQLFDARRKSSDELSKRGQRRQPRTGEDRRLAGVPACRNRVAEIGSRIAAQRSVSSAHSGKTGDGRRSVRGRELHLEVAVSDGVRRKTYVGPSASSDRAIPSSDQPTPIGGAHAAEKSSNEQPGSMTCSIARACATEGRHFGLLRRRHPSRGGGSTQPRPRCEARRSSERAAREPRRGDRSARGQDRNVFRFLETCRDVSPGATNPIEKRRSGRSELGRRETSGSSSREWRKPELETRTENAGWRLDR